MSCEFMCIHVFRVSLPLPSFLFSVTLDYRFTDWMFTYMYQHNNFLLHVIQVRFSILIVTFMCSVHPNMLELCRVMNQ